MSNMAETLFHRLGPTSKFSEDRAVRGGPEKRFLGTCVDYSVSIREPGPSIGFDRRQTTHILAAAEIQAHHSGEQGGKRKPLCLGACCLALWEVFLF